MGEFSDYRLFISPNFLEGIGRTIDFWGFLNQYVYDRRPQDADYKAIESDWIIVGKDISHAIHEYKEDLEPIDV